MVQGKIAARKKFAQITAGPTRPHERPAD